MRCYCLNPLLAPILDISAKHPHTHGSMTPSFIHRSFCLRGPICLRVDPAYIMHAERSFTSFSLSVSPLHGPLRPGARPRPEAVGSGSQQGPKLRHTISTRELESLQLEGQQRTSPSLCRCETRFGKLCEGRR